MAQADYNFDEQSKTVEDMESKFMNIHDSQSHSFQLKENNTKISLGQIFVRSDTDYLNPFTLFIAHFNAIPNYITASKIDCKKALEWFIGAYKSEFKDCHYNMRQSVKTKTREFDDIYQVLRDDLIVHFDMTYSTVRFFFKEDIRRVEAIICGIQKFRHRKEKPKPEISLLIETREGIKSKKLEITKPKLNIEDNYNDDFKPIHQSIATRLSKKNSKGLVLLHGKPGTGKTSYIRYLISFLKKEVIFLPPTMAGVITSPGLISVLIDHPNSIFVIEDAENIVLDREKNGDSPISALLNISDGLLSDCLNIQIICSFNTDLSKVDNALMRKGRLIAKYEFKELEMEKAQALSDKLSFNTKINTSMTLTDIYNQDELSFTENKHRNAIGFTANVN